MTDHARSELEPPAVLLKRGSKGQKVRQVQEWLCLHGFHTAVDGVFGPATEAALKAFQRSADYGTGLRRGVVDGPTWILLTEPLRRVVEWERDPLLSLGREIVTFAYAHLDAHPREVGGPNAGPWVRLYMDGHEGRDWPWCAGFATYVLRQALGHDKWRTFDCDELASKAMMRGVFRRWEDGVDGIRPGSLFLVRRDYNDWTHCGIVTAVGAEHFETVEGNTNTSGAREGTAVHARIRVFGPNIDFVLTGGDR